jgi:hypothetical protein
MLVDNCIRHFGDWWLIGYKYFDAWGLDMWDLCNQFVVAALTGGLVTLIVFILIYKRSFGAIGAARKRADGDWRQEWFLWCLGAVLFGMVVASFGINYNHHLVLFWFSLLACISATTSEAKDATIRRAEAPVEWQSPTQATLSQTVRSSARQHTDSGGIPTWFWRWLSRAMRRPCRGIGRVDKIARLGKPRREVSWCLI